MKENDYLYAVGRIRVRELGLLTSADIKRLISAKGYNEAVSMLQSKGYDIDGVNFEKAVEAKKNGVWQLMKEVLPDISQFDSLIIMNDFANLKAAVKSAVSGNDGSAFIVSPSVYDGKKIYDDVAERSFSALPEVMKECGEKAYDILLRTNSAQLSDAVIDKAVMEAMIKFSEKKDSKIFAEIAQSRVACADIKTAYRCILAGKNAEFMKYSVCSCDAFSADEIINKAMGGMESFLGWLEKTDYKGAAEALKTSATAFEKYCDDLIIRIIEKGKMTMFGIDPIVAFYLAVQAEILSVKVILSGKLNGFSEETISARVRELYV